MKRPVRIFFAVLGVMMAFQLTVFCLAQTGSLEDMKAELRANVRREMGLDSYTSSARVAAPLLDPVNEKTPQDAGNEERSRREPEKTLIIVFITAVVSVILTKIAGKKKNKKTTAEKHNDKESRAESKGRSEDPTQSKEREPFPVSNESEEAARKETAIDIYEKIERLQALKEKGILSEEEFSGKKRDLLNRI